MIYFGPPCYRPLLGLIYYSGSMKSSVAPNILLRTSTIALLLGIACLRGQAQTPASQAPSTAAPAAAEGVPSKPAGTVNIDQYMHKAWDTLSRSMTDCHSLIDPKLTTRPVLYVPAEMAIPPEVSALKAACGVSAEHLPKRIDHPGALMPGQIKAPGLLYLPNKYVVPGGRFNEMYGWDSYFIILGLLEDERRDLARGMVENFFFEIEHYGNILNANRTYYLTRSQPPLLSSMIRDVYDADIEALPQGYAKTNAWLARAYGFAVKDHDLWLEPAHRAGDTGLARYHDLGEGPVPEMEDASDYYPDVIHWLLAHPDVKTDYLVDGPADVKDPAADDVLAKVSCDPRTSKVCARAHEGTHWLTRNYYEGDRADRESGFDQTARFGPFSGSTEDYAPACLNSLLYKYELDLVWMAAKLGKAGEAAAWKKQAASRKAAIDKYLWSASRGLYFDYVFDKHQQTSYEYISTFYPLWAGLATPEQAKAVAANLKLFLQPGGIAMSTTWSGLQWDLPYGWAPTTWFAVAGLVKTGDIADADEISKRFMHSVESNYDHDGTVREKYNVVDSTADVKVSAGYTMNVIGFGWTNGVYLKCKHLLGAPAADARSVVE
jgi:alpha,alpha-trehalase